jgi:hypothetical protein
MRGSKRDLGMDPRIDIADTKNRPEVDTYGLARSPLFQNLASTTPSVNSVIFGIYGCLPGELT